MEPSWVGRIRGEQRRAEERVDGLEPDSPRLAAPRKILPAGAAAKVRYSSTAVTDFRRVAGHVEALFGGGSSSSQ